MTIRFTVDELDAIMLDVEGVNDLPKSLHYPVFKLVLGLIGDYSESEAISPNWLLGGNGKSALAEVIPEIREQMMAGKDWTRSDVPEKGALPTFLKDQAARKKKAPEGPEVKAAIQRAQTEMAEKPVQIPDAADDLEDWKALGTAGTTPERAPLKTGGFTVEEDTYILKNYETVGGNLAVPGFLHRSFPDVSRRFQELTSAIHAAALEDAEHYNEQPAGKDPAPEPTPEPEPEPVVAKAPTPARSKVTAKTSQPPAPLKVGDWTGEDEDHLLAQRNMDVPFKQIAIELNRSLKAVHQRYYKLRDEGQKPAPTATPAPPVREVKRASEVVNPAPSGPPTTSKAEGGQGILPRPCPDENWPIEDDFDLVTLHHRGLNMIDVSIQLERTKDDCLARYKKLIEAMPDAGFTDSQQRLKRTLTHYAQQARAAA